MNQFSIGDSVVIYDGTKQGVKAFVTKIFFNKEYVYQTKLLDGKDYFVKEGDLAWES